MYTDPVDIINNILAYTMYFAVCHITMTRRYSFWITVSAEAVLFLLHMSIGNALAFLSVWRVLYWPLLHIPVLSLLYRDKWYRVSAIVLLLMLGVFLVEYLGFLTIYNPEMLTGDLKSGATLSQRILIRIGILLYLGFTYWMLVLFLTHRRLRLSRTQYLLFISFPFSMVVFFHFWITSVLQVPQVNSSYMFFALGTCIVSFIVIFVLSIRTTNQNLLEAENRRLAEQIDLQRRHYEGLSEQYADVRMMRHDIAKHMNVMHALLTEGRNEEASEYFAQVQDMLHSHGYGICEHPIVDAFLHHFVETADSSGVKTDFAVSVPSDIAIAPSDLICAFGNLLDNALEACEQAADPLIVLRSTVSDSYFLISLDNSIAQTQKTGQRHIPQLQRGLGTEILRQIASKYEGNYSFSVGDGLFHAELTLKVGNL